MDNARLAELAKRHGTPLFVVDHDALRATYHHFRERLPRVIPYYAVKALALPEVVRTLFLEGASFDVASWQEFDHVNRLIAADPEPEVAHYIWDKIIFSNTIKSEETLRKLRPYKPLVTFDNEDELYKIKQHCDTAGVVVRLMVSDLGSMVELNSKFGVAPQEAMELIRKANDLGLTVEGLSFHVGSQCAQFGNYVEALAACRQIFDNMHAQGPRFNNGKKPNVLDIGGGFPVRYMEHDPDFEKLADIINTELDRYFPPEPGFEIIAEPGRYMVARAATLVAKIIGRSRRKGKRFYYIDDGIYHTFSGVLFDHCQYHFSAFRDAGETEICAVCGPTCDGLDRISMEEMLPGDLELGDYLRSDNVGAYTVVSATNFNGFPPAKVVHVNEYKK